MKINSINTSIHTSFGVKVDDSAIASFAQIGKICKTNNEYDKFQNNMKTIRVLLPEGIIKRKEGKGLCISVPAIFKNAPSKTNSHDTVIAQYFKNPTLNTLNQIIKKLKILHNEYYESAELYKDITGTNFVIPDEFLTK